MKVNQRITRHTSPGRDPVLLAMIVFAIIMTGIAVALLVPWAEREMAMHSLHCPVPDHAMWAPSIGQAVCGSSIVIGVKAR